MAYDTDDGVSGSWMVKMVGVIVLALGLLGVIHSIHEGNTIISSGRGRRVLGDWDGDDLLMAACRQAGSARRQARPAYAVTTAVAQVGWVTLLLAGTTVEVFLFGRADGRLRAGTDPESHATCNLYPSDRHRLPAAREVLDRAQ